MLIGAGEQGQDVVATPTRCIEPISLREEVPSFAKTLRNGIRLCGG
ncbi:hypothetical protein [Streptomyces chromofuscus]|nr:hypothetical protein [Streptomyces chromofuscus]